MMSAEEFARAKEIMCRDMPSCLSCPLKRRNVAQCRDFAIRYPAEVVKWVEWWWNENKRKYGAR